jgi:hypothetical protein
VSDEVTARNAEFLKHNNGILRDAATIIKVHTISNITILNGTHIKPGITNGSHNDRTTYYTFTWLLIVYSWIGHKLEKGRQATTFFLIV